MATTTPTAPTPPKYNNTSGSLTDYGKSVGAPDVNNNSGTSGGTSSGRVTGVGGLTYDPNTPLSSAGATKRAGELVDPLTNKSPVEAGTMPAVPNTPIKPVTPTDIKTGSTSYDQAVAGINAVGSTSAQDKTNAIAGLSKYYQGHDLVRNANTPLTNNAGDAMTAVQSAINTVQPQTRDTTAVDQAALNDPFHQDQLKQQADYNSVANQGASLLKFYDQSIKQAGIPGINKELLNTKKIIDGTEDDIRKEVQAAGGFATDSQVLALAGARNKQLILNYNNLLDEKKMTMENINTRMNLAQQDRSFALQTISQRMQWDQQEMAYRDKFVANAQEGYNAVLKAVGYAGLYQSLQATGDPNSITTVERTLGLQPGQLKALASQPMDAMQALDLQLKQSQLNNSRLQGQQLQQGLGGSGSTPTISPYQQERAFRTVQSVDELGIIAQQNPGIFGRSAAFPLPDFLRTDAFRNFESQLNTLKSNIAFGELTAMREASKSGGALGQISDTEEKLLSSSLGALSMSQSPTNFQAQLTKIKDSINRWHEAMGMTGGSQPIITAPNGDRVIITD